MPQRTETPFEPEWLQRSLDRYLLSGLVFMAVLLVGFGLYKVREPDLRRRAIAARQVSYQQLGRKLFADNCAQCHGDNGTGGEAPTLNAREFLRATSDEQIHLLMSGGVSGTSMPAWSVDYGGVLTDEQIQAVIVYVRSWERSAPSVPKWRLGAATPAPR